MDGGDRAGYKQVERAVDAVYITTTMAACSATEQWVRLEVVSSEARIKSITAAGLRNASKIDSDALFYQNAVLACSKITIVELATQVAAGKVILHDRVLI